MEKNNIAIPIAIVIAGGLIAGAVYFGGKNNSNPAQNNRGIQEKTAEVRKADNTDHIFGNPNAKVVFVEYSDLQCPYCQSFHENMKKVMDFYGKDGKVAWIYRHFPLTQIHPYADKASEASECAAELGGNEKFWAYIDNIFADPKTQSNKISSDASLIDIAINIGLDKTKFTSCLASGKYKTKIQDTLKEGRALGINGTPNTFILVDGKTVSQIPGAMSFEDMKPGIDAILK